MIFLFLVLFYSSANATDFKVNINNESNVDAGQKIFSEKCTACHGGKGVGTGRAPCVSCGKYKFRGNKNSDIFATIAYGTPKIGGRASKMGAFNSILSDEDIVNIVTYLRFVENERVLSGEIDKPIVEEKLVFPEN
jgi:mono/diheme cytochrome c family protein